MHAFTHTDKRLLLYCLARTCFILTIDLNLGLSLVTDGMLDRYDRAILITADTDLRATLKTAQQLCPEEEIFVATPPGRMQRGRGLNPKYEVKPGRIAQHLLDAEYKDNTGAVSIARPAAYRP